MNARVFLLGAGYSSRAYARLLAGEGQRVVGTTRSPGKMQRLRADGVEPLFFDGNSISDEMAQALAQTTHLVVSAAPDHGPSVWASRDPLLGLLVDGLRPAMPALQWIAYLSTVGVYGNHDGEWVDEDSELRPRSARATARVEAENDWMAAGEDAGVPVAVLRLSGIYGPGRNALVNLERGTARRTVKPGQVFNRIHVADIAGSLAFLGERRIRGVFNVTDDEPGPPQDVVTYAASLMGVTPPPELAWDAAGMSPMALSFWADNKRVSNARLRQAGYRFAYPNYRLALDTMWQQDAWRGDDDPDA